MPGTWQSRWRQRVKANAGAPFEPEAVAALAMIQEHDAPSWARVRKALRDTGVSLRELDRALQAKRPRGAPADAEPEENVPADDGDADGGDATPGGSGDDRDEPDAYQSWDAPSGLYAVRQGRAYLVRYDKQGNVEIVPLGNFAARVVEETDLDNGAEVERFLTVEGRLGTTRALPPVRVPVQRYGP